MAPDPLAAEAAEPDNRSLTTEPELNGRTVTRLHRALSRLDEDLRTLGREWALVGGLAVSARAEPRTTRDVDVVLAAEGDAEAEEIIADLLSRGYGVEGQLEHTDSDRLAGMRLVSPAEPEDGLVVDLLFASSGIEHEIIEAAEELEVVAGWSVPVARTGHLITLKVLAYRPDHPEQRPMDLHDALALLAVADDAELQLARDGLALIARRGFDRGKDLQSELDRLLARPAKPLE